MKESTIWGIWTWITLIAAAFSAAANMDILAWMNIGLAFYYRGKYIESVTIEETVDDIIELIEKIKEDEKDEK